MLPFEPTAIMWSPPAVLADAAHLTHDFAILAIEEPDMVLGEIRDEAQSLPLAKREGDAAVIHAW
jgi:hypothetical protein